MSGSDEWSCALRGRIVSLRQDSQFLHYRAGIPSHNACVSSSSPTVKSHGKKDDDDDDDDDDDTEKLLREYFALDVNLSKLYERWSEVDENFKIRAPKFTGVRILRQDTWETLVSFICSSNNNISRISQMVEKLCLNYGPLIGYLNDEPYHDFPPPEKLVGSNVEVHLRQLGFGYRAKYLHQTAQQVVNGHEPNWLTNLCNTEGSETVSDDVPAAGREGYRKAHDALVALHGVGPKVADCVCLMGMNWSEAVPVDTHGKSVWQIAQRDYKIAKGKNKSLSPTTYAEISNHLRTLWGKYAGWAQSVLFTANLRSFQEQAGKKVKVKKEKREVTVKREGDDIVKVEIDEKKEVAVSEITAKGETLSKRCDRRGPMTRSSKRRRSEN
ncbi:8-oxoguanine glycosylase ogg1 [Ascosphaera aggregata]|nr:8-oxoguanine glycosylase ogg1 [Ascosphaera aggregata]